MSKEALPELVLQNDKIEGIVQHIEEGEKSDHDSHAGVNDNHVRCSDLSISLIDPFER